MSDTHWVWELWIDVFVFIELEFLAMDQKVEGSSKEMIRWLQQVVDGCKGYTRITEGRKVGMRVLLYASITEGE